MTDPTCQSCGVSFTEHLGVEGTCAELQRYKTSPHIDKCRDNVTYAQTDVDAATKRVLSEFDFGRVHQVMHMLDWKWHDEDEPPTMGAIYQVAERLLRDAAKSDTLFCSSAGFRADCRHGCVSLEFIVADWDEDIGEDE